MTTVAEHLGITVENSDQVIVELNPKAKIREESFGGLVRSMTPITVNNIGLEILRACDGEKSIMEIARGVSEKYAIPLETACADTIEYLVKVSLSGAARFKRKGSLAPDTNQREG